VNFAFLIANWQRFAIYGVLAFAALTIAAGLGYHQGVKRLWDYQVDQARAAVKIVIKQGAITERVVTEYVQIKGKSEVVEKIIEKEVVKYVDKNPGLCLDTEWRRLHDASVDTIPGTATGTDDTGGTAPTAAETLKTVTENNARCIRNTDRLTALQKWVSEQHTANQQ
jgi:hypothetical protein